MKPSEQILVVSWRDGECCELRGAYPINQQTFNYVRSLMEEHVLDWYDDLDDPEEVEAAQSDLNQLRRYTDLSEFDTLIETYERLVECCESYYQFELTRLQPAPNPIELWL